MNTQTTETRSAFGVWRRRESYLFRLDLRLEELVSMRERRSILREIRGNIKVDAAARDIDTALDSLGPPRTLARSFAETDRGNRPFWNRDRLGSIFCHRLHSADGDGRRSHHRGEALAHADRSPLAGAGSRVLWNE